VTDNRVLWDLDAQSVNALFGAALNTHRASIDLSPVDNVRDHIFTDHPWLAADPILGPWQEPTDLDVVRTGTWIVPDERPLPAELVAFLDAGTPPETRVRATAVAGAIRTDGATVAATLLLDAVGRERPPVSA
jgi:vancomycin aglycone glucosyltransferase